jgi:hypothetical protein
MLPLPIGENSVFLSSVEKRQLVELLHHYASSSTQEAEEVISLRDEYPYSQVLQVLSAKVSKDHNLKDQQQFLQSAAVYSTDRTVLKEIISTAFYQPQSRKEIVKEEVKPEPVQFVESTSSSSLNIAQPGIDTVDYAEELILDLKRLNELKLNFENVVANIEHTLPHLEQEEETPTKKRPPGRPRKKIETNQDTLIESIENSKKKIEPESSTTKEQIAIIDQFIKAQPAISTKLKADVSEAPQGDLAEVKSGEYSDTVVSETLAEILVKQGKKDKAIEVFRKLIWKFPQKKAYFAAQIEELKK